MDNDRLKLVEDVFHRALELPDDERKVFLERSCGEDAALRDEVEALLAADARTGGFLDAPRAAVAAALTAAESSLGPAPGARLGAFALVEKIGAGAMGTVWKAERVGAGYAQQVAVKLLPSGLHSSEEALARFRRERLTLARLEHPNIARLIDGGTTPDGTPYLVMELVDGVPIDVHCDERHLDVNERLALFAEVCDAVHAAHRSLVVHRDLKPANILVDREGRPRLLDFGIAKLLDAEGAGDEPGLTLTGERLMTPRYASPEQVLGQPVTTATDVYSLGVTLYELLTGRAPYRTATDTVREIETAIVHQEPERPSTAVRRAPTKKSKKPGDSTPEAVSAPEAEAARRGTSVDRLSRRLAGDLDTIVLKAMRKEPAHRYASAESFAEDIRRYLRGLPVLARRDTFAYRASKFVLRHRLAAVAAAAAAVIATFSAIAIVRSARLASARLDDVLRLSDLTRLADYSAEADSLFPARPERARDFEAWLEKARTLARTLPGHRASLEALRDRALPYDEAARRADFLAHPNAARLDAITVQREASLVRREREPDKAAEMDERLRDFDAEIEKLSGEVPERRTYRFASVAEEWQHEKLAELVSGLERFVSEKGGIADVERRLDRALSLEVDSTGSHREAWRHAIAEIAADPAYGDLEIPPQLGLVPIGRDPESRLVEFAHVASGRIPERDSDGRLGVTEETGLVFVLVPGGTFRMGAEPPRAELPPGSPNVDPAARPDEFPVSEVTLDSFLLSKYEMTQGQWKRFTGSHPDVYRAGEKHGDVLVDFRHAVSNLTWEECDREIRRMGLLLPTEAQWEYAVRAGTTTPWWTGADRESLRGAVNIADRAAKRTNVAWPQVADWPELDDGHVVQAPVDALRPNPWGFANMTGNTWEWCADEYALYSVPVAKGTGLRLWKGSPNRVGRGGSFMDAAYSVRSSHRGATTTTARQASIGVRPAHPLVRGARAER